MSENRNENKEIWNGCILIIVALIVGVVGFFLWNWVAMVVWGWFLVPIFALPAFTFWQVIGVRLGLKLLWGFGNIKNDVDKRIGRDDSEKSMRGQIGELIAYDILSPLALLGIARLVLIFV